MTTSDLAIIVRGIGPALREYVSAAISPIVARLAAVEAKEKGMEGMIVQAAPPARDGLPGVPGRDGAAGAKGADGLGFDDLSVLHDGERGVTFRFSRGEQVKEFTVTIPALIYRGVYTTGKSYDKGDTLTWGGALWHCERPTMTKPDDRSGDWKLAVKQGRDGKDGKDGVQGVVVTCPTCKGTGYPGAGYSEGQKPCVTCGGSGKVVKS